jgi:D-amino-acid dehydrogenase
VTLPIRDPTGAPEVSLTDDEYKLVFSRLGERLRIAGTAELNGYARLEPRALRGDRAAHRGAVPRRRRHERAQYWTGLRPATPPNVPLIGRLKLPNLYLSTGHGTLGWTHACGSGKSIARIISGLKPEVEFPFLGLQA